jgi:hypothetical protein
MQVPIVLSLIQALLCKLKLGLAAGKLSQLVLLLPDGQGVHVSTVQVYQLDGEVIFMLSN